MTFVPLKKKMLANKKSRRGFSLVVSLVIMGLMLLISISLVSFVVLESQLSSYKVRRCQAQANALYGLRVALGQLQLLAGDDQRVTATADILERGGSDNKSLPAGTPVDGKRYWTGVWATGGLDKSSAEKLRDWNLSSPDDKPFLGWLVSDYSESSGNYSPIEQAVGRTSVDASKGKELVRKATENFDVDSDSVELVTLVGAGTVGKKDDWKKRTVKVRRVPMEKQTDFQKTLKTSGSFAYWVGDEGVKARVNISDAYSNTDGKEFSGLKDWDRDMRSTAQRVGVEAIKVYDLFEDWWKKDMSSAGSANATRLPYVQSAEELSVYADDDSENFRKESRALYHDVSFFSRGVFSDVYNGGLRTDLSVAFEMPWFDGEDGWEKGFRSYPQFHGSREKNKMDLLSHFEVPKNDISKWWLEQPEKGLGYLYEFSTKYPNFQVHNDGWGHYIPSGNSYDTSILRGPAWDVVRNYYRLYKREVETTGIRGFKPQGNKSWTAVGMMPYSYLQGLEIQQSNVNNERRTGYFGAKSNYATLMTRGYDTGNASFNCGRTFTPMFDGNKFLIPQSMRLAPVVLRVVLRFSVVMNADTAAIVVDPIFVLHNPYNVSLEYFGLGAAWQKFMPFDLDLRRTNGKWHLKNDNDHPEGRETIANVLQNYAGGAIGNATLWILRQYAGTTSFNTAPNGTIKLLPGEVKAVFPNSATGFKAGGYASGGAVGSLGANKYEQYSALGYLIPLDYTKMEEEKDVTPEFEIDVRTSGTPNEVDMYVFSLYYPKGAIGQNLQNTDALARSYLTPQTKAWVDPSDESLIQAFGVSRRSILDKGYLKRNFASRTFAKTGESGYEHATKNFFALYDLYRAPAEDSPFAGPLVTNARPWTLDPRSNKWELGQIAQPDNVFRHDNLGAGWVARLSPTSTDFCPVEHVSGNAFWGEEISSNGSSSIVLFEVPTRPVTSLGALQSVDCSVTDFDPSYVIGASYPPVKIKELTKIFDWPETSQLWNRAQPVADHSYAANLALFDRYFFSGINYGKLDDQEHTIKSFVQKLIKGTVNPLANKRVVFIRDRENATRTDDVVSAEMLDPNKVARNFLYEGMFNVNSTSVEAWKAQLASLHGQFLKIDGAYSKAENFPIVRFAAQIGRKLGGEGAAKDSHGDDGDGWRWYRSLKDSELESLAEKIVEQVRLRGPFMSMADFVNRRVAESNQFAQKGALQAAIDEVTKINSGNGSAKNRPDQSVYPNLIPNNNAPSAKAGAPGYLMQGDILSCLGAGMSVRSDTFTIRAYGDVFGVSGVPESRAYCEAVVQRLPDWVVEEEESVLASDDKMTLDSLRVKDNYRTQTLKADEHLFEKFERNMQLKPANRLFGRRYKIVSFRWLSPDEV